MRTVLVISDTHGTMPDWLCDVPADAVLHAGDIGDDRTLFALHCFHTVHAVRGNTDATLRDLPDIIRADIDGVRFFLVHNLAAPHRIAATNAAEIDSYRPRVVVFGHTHEPLIAEKNGILYLNPGSLGRAGINGTQTYALLSLESGAVNKIEIFDMTRRSILTWPV